RHHAAPARLYGRTRRPRRPCRDCLPSAAVVAAVGPAPRPQWIEVERPHPAFELTVPELGGPASRYAIFRRDADGARRDVLSWGEPAGSGPYVMLEVYRPGAPGDRFIDPLSEIAARLIG